MYCPSTLTFSPTGSVRMLTPAAATYFAVKLAGMLELATVYAWFNSPPSLHD